MQHWTETRGQRKESDTKTTNTWLVGIEYLCYYQMLIFVQYRPAAISYADQYQCTKWLYFSNDKAIELVGLHSRVMQVDTTSVDTGYPQP